LTENCEKSLFHRISGSEYEKYDANKILQRQLRWQDLTAVKSLKLPQPMTWCFNKVQHYADELEKKISAINHNRIRTYKTQDNLLKTNETEKVQVKSSEDVSAKVQIQQKIQLIELSENVNMAPTTRKKTNKLAASEIRAREAQKLTVKAEKRAKYMEKDLRKIILKKNFAIQNNLELKKKIKKTTNNKTASLTNQLEAKKVNNKLEIRQKKKGNERSIIVDQNVLTPKTKTKIIGSVRASPTKFSGTTSTSTSKKTRVETSFSAAHPTKKVISVYPVSTKKKFVCGSPNVKVRIISNNRIVARFTSGDSSPGQSLFCNVNAPPLSSGTTRLVANVSSLNTQSKNTTQKDSAEGWIGDDFNNMMVKNVCQSPNTDAPEIEEYVSDSSDSDPDSDRFCCSRVTAFDDIRDLPPQSMSVLFNTSKMRSEIICCFLKKNC